MSTTTKRVLCEGCDQIEAGVELYIVTYHEPEPDGTTSDVVQYCPDCADLARIDWPGTIADIKRVREEID